MPYSSVEAPKCLTCSCDVAQNFIIQISCGMDTAAKIFECVAILEWVAIHGRVGLGPSIVWGQLSQQLLSS